MKNEEQIFHLTSDSLEVGISNLGAAITYLKVKTKQGFRDVCLTYPSYEERVKSGTYNGATVGRVANRIAGGAFTLNGKTYHLTKNEGEKTLHGGTVGFDRCPFRTTQENNALVMRHVSPDGDQGFPGTLDLSVTYRIEGNALWVEYSAVSDADTVWSPTNHAYFNFDMGSDILSTVLQINADGYTPVNDAQIPTGEILPVDGTVFDFRTPKAIGKEMDLSDPQLHITRGYDHNFALLGEYAATVYHPTSGIKMDVYTNLPGLQFYAGNYLKGSNGFREYQPWEGFCLEPQYFPNAVNQPNFIQPVLKAGQVCSHYIRYEFS